MSEHVHAVEGLGRCTCSWLVLSVGAGSFRQSAAASLEIPPELTEAELPLGCELCFPQGKDHLQEFELTIRPGVHLCKLFMKVFARLLAALHGQQREPPAISGCPAYLPPRHLV